MASSGLSVVSPVTVLTTPSLSITEFFGRVANHDRRLSACVVEVTAPSEEAYQRPAFDEYVLMLEGAVEVMMQDRVHRVEAGKGILLHRGTRAKWRWPGPCKYIAICLPAFSPDTCGREEASGDNIAKDEQSLIALRKLHAATQHPWLFHVARKSLWEEAKANKEVYIPPTYSEDGFTHATADPSKLLEVLNHFYSKAEGDFVCLRMTQKSLEIGGVTTVFEATAPVGDIPAIDMGHQLFPHLLGGVPTAPGVVLEELPVQRSADGKFLAIPGLDEYATPEQSEANKAAVKKRVLTNMRAHMAGAGLVGLVLGAALGVVLSRKR